jgi:hypothetical protein
MGMHLVGGLPTLAEGISLMLCRMIGSLRPEGLTLVPISSLWLIDAIARQLYRSRVDVPQRRYYAAGQVAQYRRMESHMFGKTTIDVKGRENPLHFMPDLSSSKASGN